MTLEPIEALEDARRRTLELVADLSDEQMIGPRLAIVNPLRWEIGHLAWFQEYWVLRHLGKQAPILSNGDALYDSARVAHDTRWDLPLPSKADTILYMRQVLERVREQHHKRSVNPDSESYFLRLVLFHEDMHAEAFTYTRQTLSYPPPRLNTAPGEAAPAQPPSKVLGDAEIPGGDFLLGSTPESPFVFDNEQWAHPVRVAPFSIARTAVTNAEFAAFVNDHGYGRSELWTKEGFEWRERVQAEHPLYWQPQHGGKWLRRNFDQLVPLEDRLPVLHVNWFEAGAYCRWAKRRLPAEAEWEMAACAESNGGRKREYPWGNDPPSPDRANLDSRAMGCLEAAALPAGENAFGCRQMIGNVWEWTADDFGPYPGFSPGPYKEYSAPWFGDHKVLRGGCWATRSRLIRGAYRNFYKPGRNDVWAGFRTCVL